MVAVSLQRGATGGISLPEKSLKAADKTSFLNSVPGEIPAHLQQFEIKGSMPTPPFHSHGEIKSNAPAGTGQSTMPNLAHRSQGSAGMNTRIATAAARFAPG